MLQTPSSCSPRKTLLLRTKRRLEVKERRQAAKAAIKEDRPAFGAWRKGTDPSFAAAVTLAEQRESEHALKELLRTSNRRKVDGGHISICWSSVKGRPAYDWPAIRAEAENAGIDIEQFSTVGDPSDRLLITLRGGEKPPRSARRNPATGEQKQKENHVK